MTMLLRVALKILSGDHRIIDRNALDHLSVDDIKFQAPHMRGLFLSIGSIL